MAKVHLIVKLTVRDGAFEAFHAVAQEMTAGSRREPGTLGYEWYFSADGRHCRLLETYASTEALIAHFQGPVVQQLVPKMSQHCSIDGSEVFGDPGALAGALSGFGAAMFQHRYGVAGQAASAAQ